MNAPVQSAVARSGVGVAGGYAEDGKCTAIMIFDMQASWQLPATVEPLLQDLGASIHVTPVMNGEDLQRGFKEAGM